MRTIIQDNALILDAKTGTPEVRPAWVWHTLALSISGEMTNLTSDSLHIGVPWGRAAVTALEAGLIGAPSRPATKQP